MGLAVSAHVHVHWLSLFAAMKQLQADPQFALVYQLLQIVTKESVTVYQQFYAKNQDGLKKLGTLLL